MRILYLDCYSGISGDMFLGALIDAGCPLKALKRQIAKLGIKDLRVTAKKVTRCGISATKFDCAVSGKGRDGGRTLKEIASIIMASGLEAGLKKRSLAIFESLAYAEAKVHGKGLKRLHFHEAGDTDSIVDVVGAVCALDILKIEKVYASRVNVGCDTMVAARGGALPVPAPATARLLEGVPIAYSGVMQELVTPTGAALLANIVDDFGGFGAMELARTGYGAGARDSGERPNTLRAMIGESKEAFSSDRVFVIEANIDDMSPVDYEYLTERLFARGALDVYLTPVQMKKSRPGVLLTALAAQGDAGPVMKTILNESTTIGVRYYEAERKKLERSTARVKTKFGSVTFKISTGPGGIRKASPEYDDLKRIAGSKGISLNEVREEIASSPEVKRRLLAMTGTNEQ